MLEHVSGLTVDTGHGFLVIQVNVDLRVAQGAAATITGNLQEKSQGVELLHRIYTLHSQYAYWPQLGESRRRGPWPTCHWPASRVQSRRTLRFWGPSRPTAARCGWPETELCRNDCRISGVTLSMTGWLLDRHLALVILGTWLRRPSNWRARAIFVSKISVKKYEQSEILGCVAQTKSWKDGRYFTNWVNKYL